MNEHEHWKAKRDVGTIYMIGTPAGTYVGSTTGEVTYRWYGHLQKLRKGEYRIKTLQEAWETYGIGGFSFTVLEEGVEPEELHTREGQWIREFGTLNILGHKEPIEKSKTWVVHRPGKLEAIAQDLRDNYTYRDIAARQGVSIGTITNIKRKYLDEDLMITDE